MNPATAEIVSFDMALDGTSFTASPGEANEVQSQTGMNAVFIDRADGYENMDSLGVTTTQVSQALARVFRQNGTDLSYAADVWGEADLVSGEVNSGVFAWGMTATQAELDALNAGTGMSMNFTGPMSADPTTISNITLNFGPDSNWTGNWTNPGYSFSAGGGIIGPNFGSDPTQFSSNVNQSSSYVQGALVGNTGAHAAIHVIDVTLDGAGRIRDVGLARQAP